MHELLGLPSIEDLANELIATKNWIDEESREDGIDVRLQVNDWHWSLLTGDSSYDTDHRGYWGSGILAGDTDCQELAQDLIDQVEDHFVQCQE